MGMRMPGWYDIKSLSSLSGREEDEAGIVKSQEYFHSLIDQEVAKGIPASRVVIGGFSQGGAMSLISGVTYKSQLGGIFGLSCYLLLQKKIKDMIPDNSPNKETPIFMGHGDADQVVAHKWGKMSADELTKHGYNVDFRTYKYGCACIFEIAVLILAGALYTPPTPTKSITSSRILTSRSLLSATRRRPRHRFDSREFRVRLHEMKLRQRW
jgi:dienelactone hydrolase